MAAEGAAARKARIGEMFRRWQALNPAPTTELEYGNAYQLLVAVVLSAQATDKGVNKATAALFSAVKTPAEMVALGEEALVGYIRTIGLFKTKAKNVMALSEQLVALHGGTVPRERAALEALPGVGRKTANVVLNTLYGEPVMAVDTHVFRVSNRLKLAPGDTVLKVEQGLEKNVPAAYKPNAHHWLILHGRYICTAQRPKCPECPVADLCPWPEKTAAKTEMVR